MLRRRRDYYIGGRPRRRTGRIALVALTVVAVSAGAVAAYGPALINPQGQGAAPVAFETSPPATPGSSIAPAPHPVGSAPPVWPGPSVDPIPPLPMPCAGPSSSEPAAVVSHGDLKKKVVALTFDDGTNPENTRQILRILRFHQVNATFFPTGRSMERFADVWQAVAAANYPIANHTYGHDALAGKCYEAQRRELARAASVFEDLGIPEFPAMRPPYELFDATTAAAANAEGIGTVVLWNVDTRDWQGASAASIRRVALQGGPGSIVLMHTFPEATAAALPAIIRGYRARGFEFVTIGQLLGIDGAVPFPAPTT